MYEHHRRGGKRRKHKYRPARVCLLLLATVLFLFSVIKIATYVVDYINIQQNNRRLRQINDEASAISELQKNDQSMEQSTYAKPTPTPIQAAKMPDGYQQNATKTPLPVKTQATKQPELADVNYPNNPQRKVQYRFRLLQKENSDIVGWLSMGHVIDEAVVQRDNEFYMTHDVEKKQNVNGALFLEASCSLKTRPYMLIVYGHNMKNGSMFGSLRLYEKRSTFVNEPLITFDTMYEEGTYVIFSVGQFSTNPLSDDWLNFSAAQSNLISSRQKTIDQLQKLAMYRISIDVQIDDQILLLITCGDNDEARRFVAARRLRDNETAESVKKSIK